MNPVFAILDKRTSIVLSVSISGVASGGWPVLIPAYPRWYLPGGKPQVVMDGNYTKQIIGGFTPNSHYLRHFPERCLYSALRL